MRCPTEHRDANKIDYFYQKEGKKTKEIHIPLECFAMLICSSTCDVEPSGGLSRPECLRSGADHDSAEIPGRGGPDPSSGPVHVILH